jgi:serine protease Do
VIKINAGKLPSARWGNSDAIEVGDPVLAVGSPYGLSETITAGIISAKNRELDIENVRYEHFLQTDAAVNPGNSGGPLVNMKAEVVGINTAIVGQTSQGIGFTIPSNLAKKVYQLLRTTGISRGWVGLAAEDIDAELVEKLGLKTNRGALVTDVATDSPVARAGIKAGDVIVKWNEAMITSSQDLRIAVARTKPEDKAVVTFYRNAKKQQLTVTVGQRQAKR